MEQVDPDRIYEFEQEYALRQNVQSLATRDRFSTAGRRAKSRIRTALAGALTPGSMATGIGPQVGTLGKFGAILSASEMAVANGCDLLDLMVPSSRLHFEQLAMFESLIVSGSDGFLLATMLLLMLEPISTATIIRRDLFEVGGRKALRPLIEFLTGDRRSWLEKFLSKSNQLPTLCVSEAVLAALAKSANAKDPRSSYANGLYRMSVGYRALCDEPSLADRFAELRTARNDFVHQGGQVSVAVSNKILWNALGCESLSTWLHNSTGEAARQGLFGYLLRCHL
jgi:hypothetical protein